MIKKIIFIIALSCFFLISWSDKSFAEEGRKEIFASEVLENITKGEPVKIDDAVIVGELDLSKIELAVREIDGVERKVVESRISFINTIFNERADFGNTIFNEDVEFYEVQFNKEPDFSQAYFNGKADFRMAQFNRGSRFDGAKFNKEALFWHSNFSRRADFSWARFNGKADFYGTNFSEATFDESHFYKIADFRETWFEGDANFNRVQFDEEALFFNARFKGKIYFNGARFDEVFFTTTKFDNTVYFPGADFNRMKISWKQIEGKLDYDGQFYLALINNFEMQGYFDDADEAYYDYRVAKREYEKKWYRRLLERIFLDWTCGYGVKPFSAVWTGLIIIVVFTIFYYPVGAIQRRNTQNLNHELRNRWDRIMDAIYFSATTFIRVGYGDWYPTTSALKVPILNIKLCGTIKNQELYLSYRTLAMIEGLLGWLVMALFLITLGKVWIR